MACRVPELERSPGRVRTELKSQQLIPGVPQTQTGREVHIPGETRGPGRYLTTGGPGVGEWPRPDPKTLCEAADGVLSLRARHSDPDPNPGPARRLTVLQELPHGRRHCRGTCRPTACHGEDSISTFHVGKCRVDDVCDSPALPMTQNQGAPAWLTLGESVAAWSCSARTEG